MRFKKPVGAMQPKIQANSACWDTFYTMKQNIRRDAEPEESPIWSVAWDMWTFLLGK